MTCPVCGYPLHPSEKACVRCSRLRDASSSPQEKLESSSDPSPTVADYPHQQATSSVDPEFIELAGQYRDAKSHAQTTFILGWFCMYPLWIWTYIANTKMQAIRVRVASKGVNAQNLADGLYSRSPQPQRVVTRMKSKNAVLPILIALGITFLMIFGAYIRGRSQSTDQQSAARSSSASTHDLTCQQFLNAALTGTVARDLFISYGAPDKQNGDTSWYYQCSNGWVAINMYYDSQHPIPAMTPSGYDYNNMQPCSLPAFAVRLILFIIQVAAKPCIFVR